MKVMKVVKSKVTYLCAALSFAIMKGTMVMATGTTQLTVSSDAKAVSDDIMKGVTWVLGIVAALGVVGLIASGILYMVGGEEGHRKAKKLAIGVLIGMAICALAYTLAPTIYSWFGGNAS